MDNRLIVVQSQGRVNFDLAFQLLFENQKASHYLENSKKGLIFLWSESKGDGAIKLPVPLNSNQAADLAWAWLEEKKSADYLDYADHDGSNGKGFKVYNESWNAVGGFPYSILAVQPVWAWYGK